MVTVQVKGLAGTGGLERLDMDTRHWLYVTRNFEQTGQHWAQEIRQCEKLFSGG